MSMDPTAILAYGYALGSDDDGWNVKEATGVDDAWDSTPLFNLRQRRSKQTSLEVIAYGSDYLLNHALVAHRIEVSWTEAAVLDPYRLAVQARTEDWDDLLIDATRHLGITPVAPTSPTHDYRAAGKPACLREPIQPSFLLLARYF